MSSKRLFWLTVWGICFGYIEAAVVVYLRLVYYPQGFEFPVVLIEPGTAVVELIREAVTLLFLWAASSLAFQTLMGRLGGFMFLFGTWDIFYYLFLKILLGWPESIFTWDLLFLLPLPWAGPVWAPLVVSTGLVWAGTVVMSREGSGEPVRPGKGSWIVVVLGGTIVVVSFLIPGMAVLRSDVPTRFPWLVFWAGFLSGTAAFWLEIRKRKQPGKSRIVEKG